MSQVCVVNLIALCCCVGKSLYEKDLCGVVLCGCGEEGIQIASSVVQ